MESITMLSHNATMQTSTLPAKIIKPRNSASDETCDMSVTYEITNGSSGNPNSELTGSKTVSASTLSSHNGGSRGLPLSSSTVFVAGQTNQHLSSTQSVDNSQRSGHVVTIRINPDNNYQKDNNTEHNKENNHQSIVFNPENKYKSNTRVSLNQTSPINTIGKFIVNICESSGTDGYQLNNTTCINTTEKPTNGCVRISLGSNNSVKDISQDTVEKVDTMKTATNGNMNNPYFFCSTFPYTQSNLVPSGQCSPSDTLDSGTCSDLDGTPPPLPKKKLSKSNGSGHKLVSVTVIGSTTHDRTPSLISSAEADSEDSESNISCDSLNSSELSGASLHEDANTFKSDIIKAAIIKSEIRKADIANRESSIIPKAPKMPAFVNNNSSSGFLPQGLLQDIRKRSVKLTSVTTQDNSNKTSWKDEVEDKPDIRLITNVIQPEEKLTSFKLVSQVNNENRKPRITDVLFSQNVNLEFNNSYTKPVSIVNESTYEDRKLEQEKQKQDELFNGKYIYDTDKYYDFHLNENVFEEDSDTDKKSKKKVVNGKKGVINSSSDSELYDDESMEYFAGVKDFKTEDGPPATIKSAKGTIRGVKNRVRAGIATFLQMQNSNVKSYKEKDAGKVVLYSTSMGIVRNTYQKCVLVKKILRNLLIKYEERDVFMSGEYQEEIKDRMRCTDVLLPQLFVDGQHIGDADTVERLNESGELRRMLKPYKSADACNTCNVCGGYRLLPCQICSGSKKSVHRNHFTTEFVALKCMNCDEVGLVKCEAC